MHAILLVLNLVLNLVVNESYGADGPKIRPVTEIARAMVKAARVEAKATVKIDVTGSASTQEVTLETGVSVRVYTFADVKGTLVVLDGNGAETGSWHFSGTGHVDAGGSHARDFDAPRKAPFAEAVAISDLEDRLMDALEALEPGAGSRALIGLVKAGTADKKTLARLTKVKDPAVAAVLAEVYHRPYADRAAIADALHDLKEPAAIKPLADILADPCRGVAGSCFDAAVAREYAAMGLVKIGTPEAVDALLAALRHKDKDTRAAAAAALHYVSDPRAAAALEQYRP